MNQPVDQSKNASLSRMVKRNSMRSRNSRSKSRNHRLSKSRNSRSKSRNSRSKSRNHRLSRNRRYSRKQRGGMAPFGQHELLLDGATRVQAEVSGLDHSIAELPSVIPKQAGGRRKRNGRRSQRSQRGGELAEFGGSYELLPASVVRGVNPQFGNEQVVNPMYGAHRGAQGV